MADSFTTLAKCNNCHIAKPVVWDCAWDSSHKVCQDCAAACSRCGRSYCDTCRIVLVQCETCDGIFCPSCKPAVCVCIIPRLATCFMINFKSNNSGLRVIGGQNDDIHAQEASSELEGER